MDENGKYKITPGTIARYIILILGLVNLVLQETGHSVIPINNELFTEFVTLTWVIISSLVAAYKNNSTSQAALAGDALMNELKREAKEGKKEEESG